MTNEVLQKIASDEQNISSSNGLEAKAPLLRFRKFTHPWRQEKLSDFTSRIMRKNSNNETELPLTISSKDGLVDQVTFFNKKVSSKDMSGYYLLKNGEFAYNKSYSNGYDFGSIKRLERYEMGALSTLYICFSLKKHCSDYIKHYFDSLKWYRQIYIISAEGARNHGLLNVPTDDFFATIHFLSPDIEEQKKIADFLSLIDQRIEKQRQLVENLKKYKRGLFLKLYNDSEKKGYKICDLGKYCATGALSKDDIDASGKYPCILYGELFTKYGEVIKQVASRTNIIPTYLSGTNEILFPSSTTADAQSLIFPSSLKIKNIFLGGDLFTIKLKNEFDSDFISYLVNFKYKNTLARYAQGITIIHLHYTDIKEQVIDIPNVNTQFNISSVMRKIETIIEMNSNELNSLLLMKKGFLQKMFI